MGCGALHTKENMGKIKDDDSLRPSCEFAYGGVDGREIEGEG